MYFYRLRESLVPLVVGLAFGLGVVVATTRFIQSMLFGLTPHDAPTILLAALGRFDWPDNRKFSLDIKG